MGWTGAARPFPHDPAAPLLVTARCVPAGLGGGGGGFASRQTCRCRRCKAAAPRCTLPAGPGGWSLSRCLAGAPRSARLDLEGPPTSGSRAGGLSPAWQGGRGGCDGRQLGRGGLGAPAAARCADGRCPGRTARPLMRCARASSDGLGAAAGTIKGPTAGGRPAALPPSRRSSSGCRSSIAGGPSGAALRCRAPARPDGAPPSTSQWRCDSAGDSRSRFGCAGQAPWQGTRGRVPLRWASLRDLEASKPLLPLAGGRGGFVPSRERGTRTTPACLPAQNFKPSCVRQT
jgi:hypothetical protein